MKITINKKGANRWLQGHPWIFRSDIVRTDSLVPGVVEVFQEKGKRLGEGLYSPKSLIALRMMTHGEEKITGPLIQKRLQHALAERQKLFPQHQAYRAVFGEADSLPSLIVDRFGDLLVFQTLSAGMEIFKNTIIQTLVELLSPRSIIERNDSQVREKEGLAIIKQAVVGEAPREVIFEFENKRFAFDPLEGQKTGFFLDQRFNAIQASTYVQGKMLDAFSYVGQFGIHASHKADTVTFVDSSERAIEQLKHNISLNGLQNVQTVCLNVFDYLKQMDEKKEKFDCISLDPPAFVKNRSQLKAAIRGYKEINLRAMRLLTPGGILITSSCSQHLNPHMFEKILLEASLDAKRSLQILEKRGQPSDHPILLAMPETEYLKCYILKVV